MLEAQASVCVVPSARMMGSRPLLMARIVSVSSSVRSVSWVSFCTTSPVSRNRGHRACTPFPTLSYAAYCAHGRDAPTAIDELAGQPGPDWCCRERSGPRLLRALPGAGPRIVARDGLYRYAASDLRGP